MHSYWDDFFTYKGLRDAAALARALNRDDLVQAWTKAAQDLLICIEDSVKQGVREPRNHVYPGLPGAR